MQSRILPALALLLVATSMRAQVNSGSNGSDGVFNPTTNIVVNMADHPNGIYQYTSVNISNGVTVTFIPNANNTPVVWLVQSNCLINGFVDLSGQSATDGMGRPGGPGGFRGGNGGANATSGQGPGGGILGTGAGSASYGTLAGGGNPPPTYGNIFILPLLGGSGGGASTTNLSGGCGGGGGAILIAASSEIVLNGVIQANGGSGASGNGYGGGGSGGAVRLVSSKLSGSGSISTYGGSQLGITAGQGRIRFDTLENNFGGSIGGVFTQGFQPIIIPTAGQGAQLIVTTVGGVPVSASPTGALSTPDAVLSSQQNNPIPIVVHCSNIPLNTQITVSVKPANGAPVSATGLNSIGTLSSSTATISITMPRGGGIIYASAAN